MPACFRLIPVSGGEPAILQKVDDDLWIAFGETPHASQWFRGWYGTIGFLMAIGKSYDEIWLALAEYNDERLIEVLDWLAARYRADSWTEIGR